MSPNCIPLHVVLGKSYTSLTVEEYLQLKHVLCTSLNIEKYAAHPFSCSCPHTHILFGIYLKKLLDR